MTRAEADAFALSLVREAMTTMAPRLNCQCGHPWHDGECRMQFRGSFDGHTCACWQYEPTKVKASTLLADIAAIITQRNQVCYGAPWQGDAKQADELSRAVVQRFLLEDK